MKKIELQTIFEYEGNRILQEPNNKAGGTWGVFIVEVNGERYYYCHANQAISVLSKKTGLNADDIYDMMMMTNDYRLLYPAEYEAKMKSYE